MVSRSSSREMDAMSRGTENQLPAVGTTLNDAGEPEDHHVTPMNVDGEVPAKSTQLPVDLPQRAPPIASTGRSPQHNHASRSWTKWYRNIAKGFGLSPPEGKEIPDEEQAFHQVTEILDNLKEENVRLRSENQQVRAQAARSNSEKDEEVGRIKLDAENCQRREAEEMGNMHRILANCDAQLKNAQQETATWKNEAAKLTKQIGDVEQSNSKRSDWYMGSRKDSAAIPPNLEKAAFLTKDAAHHFTRICVGRMKQHNLKLEEYEPLKQLHHVSPSLRWSKQETDRFWRYALLAHICQLLFQGLENDCYMTSEDDDHDHVAGAISSMRPADEENDFFLNVQDSEARREKYLSQYNTLSGKMPVKNVIASLQKNTSNLAPTSSSSSFERFYCRKLRRIVDVKIFPELEDVNEAGHHQQSLSELAIRLDSSDAFKSFLNLMLHAWLLHRLAFSFNPPARIFRYARGVLYDTKYRWPAVPIDDADLNQHLKVGLMVVPGFQLNNTYIASTVYLVSGAAILERPRDETGAQYTMKNSLCNILADNIVDRVEFDV